MKSYLSIIFILIVSSLTSAQYRGEFIRGADVSFIPQIEDAGGVYSENGTAADPIQIFKNNDLNYYRLRIWHTPSEGYCDLAKTLEMSKRIKDANLGLMLDFHYSDWWADPGQQNKPAAWENISFSALTDSVYAYTFDVIAKLKSQNTLPEIVQIGNEINPGMLWPDGRVGGDYENSTQWNNLTTLLKSGIQAVKDAAEEDTVKIMIHVAGGGNNSACRWFMNNLNQRNVEFDIFGVSFYPWWHGTLTQLENNLNDLARTYNKDLLVAETAYPWTLNYYDSQSNIVGSSSQLHAGYSASQSGQRSFLNDLFNVVRNVRNGRGIGVLYWAPEYISAPRQNSPWENLALFDFQGNALAGLSAFHKQENLGSVSVTFNLNTALHPDTISASSFVQLRGEVVEYGTNYTLPGGLKISWDNISEIVMQNVDGNIWQTKVEVVPNTTIHYKFWTGKDADTPTNARLGWEGPIAPVDGSNGNYRILEIGEKDTVVNLEFYNPLGLKYDQFWRPYSEYEDSVAVLFRINLSPIINAELFDHDNDSIGLRGDDNLQGKYLSWNETKFYLERELYSFDEGSFYSGTVYFAKNDLPSGSEIAYKFVLEGSSVKIESFTQPRIFGIPTKDTTLSWVYFDDMKIITGIDEKISIPGKVNLLQNYPNPFNPSTLITFALNEPQNIRLNIYNSIGEKVYSLFEGYSSAGKFQKTWNGNSDSGKAMPAGIYFLQMISGNEQKNIKLVLLR
ncbi:MAG: glycosyl hydrolase 53 family protein [Melioribacteraceae bacterium]|nr:glycosyl hydrolase 53 family protein [Melioribacteraceae bacterium]MCF8263194.1 glycosyl hydrolase 53 family protein [Melioribacteraceae bacterium]MCF8431294.1 glycosyl hydrolase 53 family protein [Melioribacteraceae bacterium]